jgi:AraC family transcriptional regulator
MVGCQDLARNWPDYARRRALFAGEELLVCEWHCHGEARSWGRELKVHAELNLPREGLHLRAPSARRQYVIDPATAGFAHAGDEYRRASPTAHPATSTLIAVRGALADSLVPRHCARAPAVTAVAAKLHLHLARAADPLEVEELALALVRCTLAPEAPRALPVSPARRRLAEEIEHVIATRFAERLTLEAIARVCKTSPFHASRVFRTVTGETVHRRLTRVRLWSALFQLHRGGRPSQIALSTGFSSHSHFTSAFRAALGVAPSSVCAPARRTVSLIDGSIRRSRR